MIKMISRLKLQISSLLFHPLISGSAIMVIGSNTVNALNYLFHLLMGRMLGPSSYGELATLISLAGLLGVIPAALSLVVIKYISSAKKNNEISILIRWLRAKSLQLTVVFSIVILLVIPYLSNFLNISEGIYFLLVLASLVLSIQSLLNRSILQGLLKFKETVLSQLSEIGAKVLLSVILVYMGLQVFGTLMALVFSALFGWYISSLFIRIGSLSSDLPVKSRPMLRFAFPVLLQSLATTSLFSSDVILVKHFFSSYEAGIYAALSTLGKIIFFGVGPISGVMFPLISQRKAMQQDYKKIFQLSFFGTLLIVIGLLLIYWIMPEFAIRVLYGESFIEAKDLLIWFGIFMALFTLSSLIINYCLSINRTYVVVYPVIAAFAQIVAILFFHQTLFMVILISIIVTALLFIALLIYSSHEKSPTSTNQINFSDSTSI